MNANEQLIGAFYTAFQNRDYEAMQKCYSDDATFSDEVFKDLNAEQVRKMWEMLIEKGCDLQITFEKVEAGEKTGSAEWTAVYTFSKTGRKVSNHIRSSFLFQDGKILQHTDRFNLRKWLKQAFGPIAAIPFMTAVLKSRVQKSAKKNLFDYMNQRRS